MISWSISLKWVEAFQLTVSTFLEPFHEQKGTIESNMDCVKRYNFVFKNGIRIRIVVNYLLGNEF